MAALCPFLCVISFPDLPNESLDCKLRLWVASYISLTPDTQTINH